MRVSSDSCGRRRFLLGLIVAVLLVMSAAPASADRVCWKAHVGATGWQNKTCAGPDLPGGQLGDDTGGDWPVWWGVGVWVPNPAARADENSQPSS